MTVRRLLSFGGLIVMILVAAQPVLARSTPQTTQSLTAIALLSKGAQGHGGGTYAALSADGHYVAFESAAPDLAPGQVQDSWDTYLGATLSGTFTRISTQSNGAPVYNPGDYTSSPAVSADGRFIAFNSEAENLVSSDGNGMPDVFIHDRLTGSTQLISVATDGKSGNADSYTPAISTDGRYVAFQSFASNLVSHDTNNSMDVFLRDRQTGKTELVTVNDQGIQGSDPHDYGFPGVAISGDGRYVAFSYQSLPVTGSGTGPNIYLRDRQSGTTRFIAQGTLPALSSDGRSLAFVTSAAIDPGDKNNGPDVYLYDIQTGQFEWISIPSSAGQTTPPEIHAQPSLSADGRYVAFETTAKITALNTGSYANVYLRDRQTRSTTLVSAGLNGSAGNGDSDNPSISADGSVIAFNSMASNLVAGDLNGAGDVFIYSRVAQTIANGDMKIFLPVVSQ